VRAVEQELHDRLHAQAGFAQGVVHVDGVDLVGVVGVAGADEPLAGE
jgi:hypothetical protein